MSVAELHEEYGEALARYALMLVHDLDQADDLVQETFVRLLGHLALLDQLKPHQRRAWLYQTLKRLYLDRRATQAREAAFSQRFAFEVETTVEADDSAGYDPFELVPEADRQLVEMRYRLGLNSREIAGELGIPAATVRSRLHQAIKRLRAHKKKFL